MSRKQSRVVSGLSPIQRKACIVLAACVLAVVISFVLAWILPQSLNLFGANDSYDPDLYPVDTSLEAVLKDASADDSYITSSLFVGDRTALALQKDGRITLDQYAGKEDLKISNFLKESCVAFEDDANTYTIPQAIAKMKARRVYVMIGSNDVDGSVTVDEFMNDYKQALQNIKNSYTYCDLIACAIPPVVKDSENAAQTQTLIDQFNQAIAEACNEMGYKYLNLSEVLKDSKGYAEASYVDTSAGTLNAAGANAVLEYVKSHAYQTDDTRPDTDDIPKRAAQAASGSSASPTPSATPTKFTANYAVEDSAKGTLTGNGKTGVTSLEIQAESGTQVSVTAVPAEGYTFYKWSDGVTDATRYDVVKKDISVTAMFNDARYELTLDRGDTTIKKGESISVTATVKLGGKNYDNSQVEWAVNDELQGNGPTFTFTPNEAGTYVVKAGFHYNEIDLLTAQITVTVQSDPTAISISGTSTITAGGSTTLNANVQNKQGDVTWRCDETSWQATGDQVTFTANQEGTYHIRASNNGAEAVFELKVSAAPTPVPTPTASPAPSSDSTKQEG